MLQALVLGRDLLPLALARRELAQFIEPLAEIGTLGLALGKFGARLRRHLLEALPIAKRLRRVARQDLGPGMRVEELALGSGAKERLVRVLAMEIEQPLARFLELGERPDMAVDEAARAPGAIDRAPQHELARIAGEIALGEPAFHGFGDLKLAGELGALGALAHERRIAAAADQQLQGVHQE